MTDPFGPHQCGVDEQDESKYIYIYIYLFTCMYMIQTEILITVNKR